MSCDSLSKHSDREVLEILLAQVEAALDPYYGDSDPSTYVAMYADAVTAFDPWSGGKLEDAAVKDHLMGFAGRIPAVAFEIVDPRVDVYGDTAVFAFNVDLADQTGTTVAVWNTTQIHHRTGGGWELVHSHWSFATPPPEELGA